MGLLHHEISAGLSSKLFAFTLRRAMLEAMPWTPGVTKSLRILLYSPPHTAIIGEVSRALRICSSGLCFFLLKQKVLSILGSGLYRNGLRIKKKVPTSTITNATNAIKKKRKIK